MVYGEERGIIVIEIDLKCLNCGGRLEINLNREKSFCPYCDSEFSVYRKLNENLEEVKKLCYRFKDTESCVASSPYLETSQIGQKARKNFEIPLSEKIFLICDATVWQTCKKGFAVCSGGLYLRGNADNKSHHYTWERFKTMDIYGQNALVIGEVAFSLPDILVSKMMGLLKEIQRII